MSSIVVDPEDINPETTDTQDITQEAQSAEDTSIEQTLEAGEENISQAAEDSGEDISEVPDKFKGKSVEDIIGSYTNLEKELGRKSQEIGELRKLSDSFLQAEVTRNNSQQNNLRQKDSETTNETEEVDFYDDPGKAVNSLIENHPKFQEFQKFQAEQQQEVSKKQLEQTHPDYIDIVKDSKFQDWVQNSKFRQDLFRAADGYNYEAADELISHWKERSMIDKTKEVKKEQETQRKQSLKASKTESRASTEAASGGKIYRRADLIRLKQTDPNRYADLADEITKAYGEGRVK